MKKGQSKIGSKVDIHRELILCLNQIISLTLRLLKRCLRTAQDIILLNVMDFLLLPVMQSNIPPKDSHPLILVFFKNLNI